MLARMWVLQYFFENLQTQTQIWVFKKIHSKCLNFSIFFFGHQKVRHRKFFRFSENHSMSLAARLSHVKCTITHVWTVFVLFVCSKIQNSPKYDQKTAWIVLFQLHEPRKKNLLHRFSKHFSRWNYMILVSRKRLRQHSFTTPKFATFGRCELALGKTRKLRENIARKAHSTKNPRNISAGVHN